MTLDIRNVTLCRERTPIVRGASLTVAPGEIVLVRGVNGSGKSTLLSAMMGHPAYTVEEGSMTIDGVDMTAMPTHERARKGLFLALQQPPELAGISLKELVRSSRAAVQGVRPNEEEIGRVMTTALGAMRLDGRFADRSVNEGFSGGEKKRSELVQMLALTPKYALLDEPDSGLDADALAYAVDAILALREKGTGFLLVSHAEHFVSRLPIDRTFVLAGGILTPTYAQPRSV